MDLRTFVDRYARYGIVVAALILATVLPAIATAATLTQRSVALSSASADADGVTYTVNFTAVAAAEAFVVDFCSDSPLVGEACASPAGFSASGVASTSPSATSVAALDGNTVRVTSDIDAAEAIEVALTGINNPTASGPLYARIVTFDTETNANGYQSEIVTAGYQMPGRVDDGGAAIYINDTVGVSGAVLEALTFCVSGAEIEEDCKQGGGTELAAPVLKLGETVGDVVALQPGVVSSGNIYTQLSTNAANGAIVRIKSNATNCGGLIRAGAPSACDIAPALDDGIIEGDPARFGLLVNPGAETGANGTFQAVPDSGYNGTTYALNYVAGNATGVTSVLGDAFLNTAGAPANNKNMTLTFGATVTNETPAGLYSADLNLIATGRF